MIGMKAAGMLKHTPKSQNTYGQIHKLTRHTTNIIRRDITTAFPGHEIRDFYRNKHENDLCRRRLGYSNEVETIKDCMSTN